MLLDREMSVIHAAPAPPSDDMSALTILQAVVLAGGTGTRLWPLSREQYPKQLIDLLGSESLLQTTSHRLDGLAQRSASVPLRVAQETLVVCGDAHRFMTQDQLSATGKPARFVIEPVGRNTAPAMTVAALAALAQDSHDPILVAMPADHAIRDLGAFQDGIARAAIYAKRGAIATLGIVPTHPETGFGYIRIGMPAPGESASGVPDAFAIERFVEKPNAELAGKYVESGQYLWNSGIFIIRASVWLAAIAAFAPAIHHSCVAAMGSYQFRDGVLRVDAEHFAACPSDSIDYAVMEKIGVAQSGADQTSCKAFEGVVVPLSAGWSDVGSWSELWSLLDKDANGNVGRGKVVFENATSTLVHAQTRLVACVGTNDLVVVETPDAVLVAHRSCAQEIKELVGRLKRESAPEVREHRKVSRPWGYYDSIDSGDRFQVKRIVVQPGARLSLQLHHHRAEHWVVVKGTARVTNGDEVYLMTENQSTYIPIGTRHRIENPGKVPLELIEVQLGAYLGEDDIVRLDDAYGRV